MKKIIKVKIERRARQKRNPILVNTIIKLKKTNPEVAKELARPKKKWVKINVQELGNQKEDALLVPGFVLGSGNLEKKIKVIAWSFSKQAEEKIKKAKGEAILIKDEIKKNPKLTGVKLI
jgi:large subunit ribosomal protein L18e